MLEQQEQAVVGDVGDDFAARAGGLRDVVDERLEATLSWSRRIGDDSVLTQHRAGSPGNRLSVRCCWTCGETQGASGLEPNFTIGPRER
jgi:hypothetical protein